MKCPRCTHQNPAGVKFCSNCGQMMGAACPGCKTVNLPHVIPLAQKLGLDLSAFKDLRTDLCREFNSSAEVIEFEANCENSILTEMLLIPPGSFLMGSPEDETRRDDDEGPNA
jgi:formylglycine-generating enzyme required for sulfatase activity